MMNNTSYTKKVITKNTKHTNEDGNRNKSRYPYHTDYYVIYELE